MEMVWEKKRKREMKRMREQIELRERQWERGCVLEGNSMGWSGRGKEGF